MLSMSTSLRTTKSLSKKKKKKETGSESNLPVPTTNKVASQDIPTELSSDSKTDQPEQDPTEFLPEKKIYKNHKQI